VDLKVYRRTVLNTGWIEDSQRKLGRPPSFNTEEQADAAAWGPFGDLTIAELAKMRAAGFDPCTDRAAKRVRAASEEAEEEASARADEEYADASPDEREAAKQRMIAAARTRLDDTTTVAIGRILGKSDETVRLDTVSARGKIRSWAAEGGYGNDGDMADALDAALFGAG
jgi:hypothetical protein